MRSEGQLDASMMGPICNLCKLQGSAAYLKADHKFLFVFY